MLTDVVAACRAAPAVEEVLVVSPDPTLAPAGCTVLIDDGRGHAAALERALEQVLPHRGALVVMADCPLVEAATLDRLANSGAPVAVGPAQDGGTNALALRPADVIEPAFGLINGAQLIVERANAAGVGLEIIRNERLELDLDTPEDARRISELDSDTATQRLLATLLQSSTRAR